MTVKYSYFIRIIINNNNNEYLERLTHTGPKHLHVLYKYILSKFNVYNIMVVVVVVVAVFI